MSDQPEKQEKSVSEENVQSQQADQADAVTAGEGLSEGETSEDSLGGILDDSDDFDEIDLFDEGLLDDLDASPETGEGSDVSDAASEDTSSDKKEQAASDEAGSNDESTVDAPAESASEKEPETAPDSQLEPASDSVPEPDINQYPATEPAPESEPDIDLEEVTGDVTETAADQSAGPDAADIHETAQEEPEDFSKAEEILGELKAEEAASPASQVDAAESEESASESEPAPEPEGADISLEVEEKTEGTDSVTEQEAGDKPQSAEDTDAFGDDLGISLSDDELWDDSDDDDIPLFDDEPEEPVPYGPGAAKPEEKEVSTEAPAAETEAQPAQGETEAAAPQGETVVSEEGAEPSADTGEENEDADVVVVSFPVPAWVPWFVSGLASAVLVAGIFVLWGMLSSAPSDAVTISKIDASSREVSQRMAASPKGDDAQDLNRSQASAVTAVQDVPHDAKQATVETFNLAPFIIPVMRQGELVFFKLTVELVVPDMKTKQELKKREAWVRDAIYTELKGIEVGPGTKGEFLLNYRRPLKKRIEKELAPLEIKDVRLMGYVLK